MSRKRVGVLGLQGAAREHRDVLERLGHHAVDIRKPASLAGIEGLVLPGGESTTMSMLLESSELFDPIAGLLADGLPAFGTCAGMILLSSRVSDGRADQRTFGTIDVGVQRNGYGRQISSFEQDISITGLDDLFRAVFIRAPKVTSVGDGVEVLAEVTAADHSVAPVVCRSGAVMVTAFHPELTDDSRLHELWLAQ
jgi:pyridoxal 5'-phosphate synthase pdxT subunit